ncbi:MAG: hypothetical protein ABIU63_05405 [Chitinophagaceae bacterium]
MKFQPAVQFQVVVNGHSAIASVLEEIDHPVKTIFLVAFSDGFEDEFMLEDDGNVYGSGITAIPYAKGIRFDIAHLIGLDPNRFYYSYNETIDGLRTNVWVIEGDSEARKPIYKVYYFEYFRFALQRSNDGWIVSHKPQHGREPDEKLVEKIGFLLDSLLEESGK